MKMSEAYDRTKKLESMIADYGVAISILKTTPYPMDGKYSLSCPIVTLEEKRKELIEAVTELGNMDVVAPPTPGAVATPEDNAAQNIASKAYELQHVVAPTAPSEKYGWTKLQLLGELCLFSANNGRTWCGPFKCIGYFGEKVPPYQASGNGFWPLAKWFDGIEKPA